jgi:transposase
MDSTAMEANASLKSLENKFTKEQYWDYVKRLAAAEGIDPTDGAAVRRFDKNRPDKKVSNKEWQNPHDPEAKVGKTKKGATAMIYKVEHVADMDTGALLDARILPGDQGDQEELCDKVLELEIKLDQALDREPDSEPILSNTTDKGYYSVKGITESNAAGIRTVSSDPLDRRRVDELSNEERRAVRNAKRAVESKSGKDLLKKRGMYLERSFAHTCNQGGARRTTLRGREKIQKRYFVVGAAFNLSLMLLKHLGVGTPKQWVARSNISIKNAFFVLFEYIRLKIMKNDFIGSNHNTCVLTREFIY